MSLKILFGTETGTAERCADDLARVLGARGVPCLVVDMADLHVDDLARESFVVVITATFGSGGPPSNAGALLKELRDVRPDLSGLQYAVMGLGDSSYPRFAQCGKDFDALLGECGGQAMVPRIDVDGDPEASLVEFQQKLLVALEGVEGLDVDEAPPPPKLSFFGRIWQALFGGPSLPTGPVLPTRKNPASATLSERRLLSGAGATRETHHHVLELDGTYDLRPGDCIGVLPTNDPALVRAVAEQVGLDPSLHGRLAGRCLQRPTSRLLRLLGEEATALAEDPDALESFGQSHHVLQTLQRWPTELDGETFLTALAPLAPRLYSLASAGEGDRVELCVARTRYTLGETVVDGVASSWLADRLEQGDSLPWYPHPNPAFRLPDDDRPLVMVCAGTGIAPFRGYLQELDQGATARETWLFFGHRTSAHDDLYGEELRDLADRGVLHHLELAWSRDQDEKVYVQHRIEASDALWTALSAGARVRVCGDAASMAPAVRAAFVSLASRHGEDGQAWLDGLLASGDYLEDVY